MILSLTDHFNLLEAKKANPELFELIHYYTTYDTLFIFVLIIGFYEMLTKPSWFKTFIRVFLICILLGTEFSGLIPIKDFYYGVYNTAWFSAAVAIVLILIKIGKFIIQKITFKKQHQNKMDFLRIRFVIPEHYFLKIEDNQTLDLKVDQRLLHFKITSSEANIYRIYTLDSKPFDFIINSTSIQKIIDSLYLLCTELDYGVLINPNLSSSWFNKSHFNEINPEIRIENNFIGAKVFPSGTKFIGSNPVSLHASSSLEKFETLLNKYVGLEHQNSENLIRAIEIYNTSIYLNIVNQTARFILLMTAIESLIEQPKVSKRLQNSLDSYIKRIKKLKIKSNEKASIQGSLYNLKKTSIKKSGKILVESLLDNDKKYNEFSPAVFFSHAYDLRSKFVHSGVTKTKYLDIRHNQLQSFVKDIIKSYFDKFCNP